MEPAEETMNNHNHIMTAIVDPSAALAVYRTTKNIHSDPNQDLGSFLLEAEALVPELPFEVRRKLKQLRDPGAPGCLLLRGFPVDRELPATPVGGLRPTGNPHHIGEALLLAIGNAYLGESFTYKNEKLGAIPADIVPVEGNEEVQSNEGSRAPLGFHTEICFDAAGMPDFLALLCLRKEPNGKALTHAVDARDVVAAIPPEVLAIARQARFHSRNPASFEKETAEVTFSEPHAIIEGDAENPGFRLDLNVTKGLDDEAQAALKKIAAAMSDTAFSIELQPGDMLVMNNKRVCHARSGFDADFGEQARWLLRGYFKHDTWSIRDRFVAKRRIV